MIRSLFKCSCIINEHQFTSSTKILQKFEEARSGLIIASCCTPGIGRMTPIGQYYYFYMACGVIMEDTLNAGGCWFGLLQRLEWKIYIYEMGRLRMNMNMQTKMWNAQSFFVQLLKFYYTCYVQRLTKLQLYRWIDFILNCETLFWFKKSSINFFYKFHWVTLIFKLLNICGITYPFWWVFCNYSSISFYFVLLSSFPFNLCFVRGY